MIGYTTSKPPVSVIVCARNEAENLSSYLPLLLEQDYPKYEVIVVNDGSTDESSTLLEQLDKTALANTDEVKLIDKYL